MGDDQLGRHLEGIDADEFDGEVLYDEQGHPYELSDEYRKKQLEQVSTSAEKEMQLQIAKELLESSLSRLSKKQKEVIYYTMLGYPHSTIARQLHISVSMVKKHLEAAKIKLAKYIDGNVKIMQEATNNGTEDTDRTDD